jgi:hypothetical protein
VSHEQKNTLQFGGGCERRPQCNGIGRQSHQLPGHGRDREVNDSMIVVTKGKEKFEVARDSSTKVTGDLKVGDKVTIHYTMTAKEIEAKADKAKKDDKAAASPSPKK